MCRYAFHTYKRHFACFRCRKSFKQLEDWDILARKGLAAKYARIEQKIAGVMMLGPVTEHEIAYRKKIDALYLNRQINCPECNGLMANMGLDFKAPKKTAIKKWKIIEGMFKIGIAFHSCGCYGTGYVPTGKSNYEAYLQGTLADYEETLSYHQNKSIGEFPDKNADVAYWSDRILKVNNELAKIKIL